MLLVVLDKYLVQISQYARQVTFEELQVTPFSLLVMEYSLPSFLKSGLRDILSITGNVFWRTRQEWSRY